jgi:hypothetical protein
MRGGDRLLPPGTPRDERRSHGGSQARLAAPVSHCHSAGGACLRRVVAGPERVRAPPRSTIPEWPQQILRPRSRDYGCQQPINPSAAKIPHSGDTSRHLTAFSRGLTDEPGSKIVQCEATTHSYLERRTLRWPVSLPFTPDRCGTGASSRGLRARRCDSARRTGQSGRRSPSPG